MFNSYLQTRLQQKVLLALCSMSLYDREIIPERQSQLFPLQLLLIHLVAKAFLKSSLSYAAAVKDI